MRLQSPTSTLVLSLLLAEQASARYQEIKQMWEAKVKAETNKLENELRGQDVDTGPFKTFGRNNVKQLVREFAEPMKSSIEKLNGYGCWCYLREEYVRGRGKPKNEVDQLCKTMALGYDCAIIDGERKQEDNCPEPWNIPYNAVIGGHDDEHGIFKTCGEMNPRNTCKQMACAIEGHFVSQLMATMVAIGGKVDNEYYHNAGKANAIPGYGKKDGWNPDEPGHCSWEDGSTAQQSEEEEEDEEHSGKGNGNGGGGNGGNGHLDDDIDSIDGTTEAPAVTTKIPADTTRQCCGEWPRRHPYHTRNGQKACCGKRTYDNTFLSCCNNDHLRVVCAEDAL